MVEPFSTLFFLSCHDKSESMIRWWYIKKGLISFQTHTFFSLNVDYDGIFIILFTTSYMIFKEERICDVLSISSLTSVNTSVSCVSLFLLRININDNNIDCPFYYTTLVLYVCVQCVCEWDDNRGKLTSSHVGLSFYYIVIIDVLVFVVAYFSLLREYLLKQ